MLREGLKFWEVVDSHYQLSVYETTIVPHRGHDFNIGVGRGSRVEDVHIEPSDKTATADILDLSTGKVREAQFLGEMQCSWIETLFNEKKNYEFVETNFGRMYKDKAYAIAYYNSLVDRRIERLENMKIDNY